MDPKPVIMLRNLMSGHRIRSGQSIYCLDKDNRLCLVVKMVINTKEHEVLRPVHLGDIDLPAFIEWSNDLAEWEVLPL